MTTTRSDLLDFWCQIEPPGNRPADFILPVWRSEILARLIEEISLPPAARILEVGCNVGRNLNHLAKLGYGNLEGVEISPYAVALLRDTYPSLAAAEIHLGAAEDVLPTLAGPYDLIFTMAFLEHVHTDSLGVFDEISRLTDTVLAIEPIRVHRTSRSFPHDLPALFCERGMAPTFAEDLGKSHEDFRDYAAWVFTTERTT